MATSAREDREFNESMFEFLKNDGFLEHAIKWIRESLEPDDVFSERALESWAENNGYVKDE